MNGDEILVRRIVSEINAELSNILKLRGLMVVFHRERNGTRDYC